MNAFGQKQRVWRWWSAAPPKEILGDRQALLQYELSLIHKAAREEAQEIIDELASLEAMKPMKPVYINASWLTAAQPEGMTAAEHDPAKRELCLAKPIRSR